MVLSVICLLIAASMTAQTVPDAFNGILPVTDPAMQLSLNGIWDLKVVEGISDDISVPQKDASWGTIPVPGCWEIYGYWHTNYAKTQPLTGFYRTSFSLPEEWKGQRTVIRLDGVLYGYDLFVNDHYAGSWHSAYNTALFDVTPFINRSLDRQELSMRVVSRHRSVGYDINDDWSPCGIFRDVTVMAVPQIHMSDLTIHASLSGEVKVDTGISNADGRTKVLFDILDSNGNVVGHDKVKSPRLWTAETPYLYTLRTKLMHGNKVLQVFEHKFGFRELTIEDKVIKLNGQPIKFRGVANHATDPCTMKVISDSLLMKDMTMMKEASRSFVSSAVNSTVVCRIASSPTSSVGSWPSR